MKTAKEILEKYLLISWMRGKPATVKRIIEAMEEYAQQKQQLNLPSDEKIRKQSKGFMSILEGDVDEGLNMRSKFLDDDEQWIFIEGAKWMREEIKKSNKNV